MARPITELTDTFKVFRDNVNTISTNVGDPTGLTTTEDSDLVTALNELDSDLHGSGGGSVRTALNHVSYAESSIVDSGLVGAVNDIDALIGGDASVLSTTAQTLVYAIKEIDEDLHGVGGGNASSDLDTESGTIVGAINEIESVFDASAESITTASDLLVTVGDNLSITTVGDAEIDAGDNLVLHAETQVVLKQANETYGAFFDSDTHLVIKTGLGLIPAIKFDSGNAYLLNTLFTDSDLTTTAQNVAGGINELDTRVTTLEDSVGTGGLDTVAQTLIGGINELDSEMGELSNLGAYFSSDNETLVDAINLLGTDIQLLADSSGALDSRVGVLTDLSAFFDSAGATASIVAALNHMANRVIDVYDENGVLLNA